MPSCASSIEHVSPAPPPPTINTGTSISADGFADSVSISPFLPGLAVSQPHSDYRVILTHMSTQESEPGRDSDPTFRIDSPVILTYTSATKTDLGRMLVMKLPSECDIAIIGAGPVGLLMANLMGLAGHRTVLLERNEGLSPLPRAIAFDDEALRSLAQIGLLDTVAAGVIANPEVFFRNARGGVLMHMTGSPSITGQPRLATFHQPTFEAQLLEGARRFPSVTLLFGANVTGTKQDAAGVTLAVDTASGPRTLRAAYLVACDGGGGATRGRIGATLEGATYPQKWLVIVAIMPGHQVRAITFGCDPARPSVQVPAKGDRLRWEFLQLPGENEADLAHDATIAGLLRPFGIETLPVIDRKTVYTFHSRVASR